MEFVPETLKTVNNISFGSSQPRKLFPYDCAPDRFGNELTPIKGTPNLGPGCYQYEEMQTPSPAEYQTTWTKERGIPKGKAPFLSNDLRFQNKVMQASLNPSPGTYDISLEQGRKVSWPGKFGSPDWTLVPSQGKKTIRVELKTDLEFRKTRNRVAYLQLYFH
ncbi:ciliary microtubule-associated protein 3 [Rhinophrynus dorsalis]